MLHNYTKYAIIISTIIDNCFHVNLKIVSDSDEYLQTYIGKLLQRLLYVEGSLAYAFANNEGAVRIIDCADMTPGTEVEILPPDENVKIYGFVDFLGKPNKKFNKADEV